MLIDREQKLSVRETWLVVNGVCKFKYILYEIVHAVCDASKVAVWLWWAALINE